MKTKILKFFALALFIIAVIGCGGGSITDSGDTSQVVQLGGKVLDDQGEPVEGAKVSCTVISQTKNPSGNEALTDANGNFSLNVTLPAGAKIVINVSEAGIGDFQLEITPSAATSLSITIILDPQGSDISSIQITPKEVEVQLGQQIQFSSVTNPPGRKVTWLAVGEGAQIDEHGVFSASKTGQFIVRAVSGNVCDQALVTVVNKSEVAVSVSPSQVTLGTGMLQQFEATVMGASDTSVTWTVDEEQDSGMIFEDGSYIAPSTPNITRTIRATSVANPAKSATAAVYVIESDEQNVQITIDPEIDVIEVGQSLQFTHTITGLSNKAVTWSVVESNGGTVTQTGLYTAPNFSGEYHVRVASQVYPLKYATAKVYVENLPPMPAPPPPPD